MEFGLDKCAKATFKRGKKVSAEGILLNDHQLIQDLDQAETYKYLGMEEGEGVQHHQMKVKIKKEYKQWIKLVLNSELNARNRIAAINTLAVPVVLYSFGIIDWKLNEIQDLDKMTRKQLCMNQMTPMQSFRDSAFYPRGGNTYFKPGWEGLEQPSNRYDLRGRDLSWDYSDAKISYEGSYLFATSGSNGDAVVTRRGKSRGGK